MVKPKGSAMVHHPEMEKELKRMVVEKRARKRIVSTRWLHRRARRLISENPDWAHGHEFTASYAWRAAFMRRAELSVRKKTNSKRRSVIERREMLL
jgi:hypothetical protein